MPNLLLIRDLVRKKNMSLGELAKEVGISYQGLQKAIKENSTKPATLKRIANALDVDENTFYKYNTYEDYVKGDELNEPDENYTIKLSEYVNEIKFLKSQLKEKSDYIRLLKQEVEYFKKQYEEWKEKKKS